MIRCMQCMEEYDERLDRCPHCHQQPQAPEPFQLPYGTMLDDRFLVGAMLGHGGFGITLTSAGTRCWIRKWRSRNICR